MRNQFVGVIAMSLLTTACGSTTEQRAATAGLTGAGIGAVVGGPIGAAIGAAAGGVGGALAPEGVDVIASDLVHRERTAGAEGLKSVGIGPGKQTEAEAEKERSGATTSSGHPRHHRGTLSPALVKEVQTELKNQDLYHGPVDGIAGKQTHQALKEYQQKEGLQETGRMDRPTLEHLNLGQERQGHSTPATGGGGNATGTTGRPVLSQDELRDRLQANGYSDVSDLKQVNANTYSAHAMANGAPVTLTVDANSGNVVAQQPAVSRQENAPVPSNASPSPNDSTSPGGVTEH